MAFARCASTGSHLSHGVQDRNLVSMPVKRSPQKSACTTVLTILKRFEFDPQLLRSGVLAVDSDGPPDEVMFFVRGAPSAVRHLIPADSLPPDYQQVGTFSAANSYDVTMLLTLSTATAMCYREASHRSIHQYCISALISAGQSALSCNPVRMCNLGNRARNTRQAGSVKACRYFCKPAVLTSNST